MVKNEVLESPAVTVASRVGEANAFISQKKTELAELLVVIGMELKCIKKDVEEALKEKGRHVQEGGEHVHGIRDDGANL